MTDEQNKIPEQSPNADDAPVNIDPTDASTAGNGAAANSTADASARQQDDMDELNDYSERLERLGGEPAPVITPEEFARLQRAGQVHIDARGRVRTTRRSDAEAGVSLRKRRAWYA